MRCGNGAPDMIQAQQGALFSDAPKEHLTPGNASGCPIWPENATVT